ncbi:MAG: TonB-dependent receptor [Acidobacteria bacterium]|nr:TonB-dependent receptor [Acidobacteriota bacterium]
MANYPFVVGLLIIGSFTAPQVKAQSAELSGLIRDPDNLTVPGAHILLDNESTGIQRGVLSNEQGLYRVTALPPGRYAVTVEAAGFQTIRQFEVVLQVDQKARLDFALTIGSPTESITVESSALLVNTSDASVSTVIGNRFVENMPLNGRSFSSLINLTPGVVLTQANFHEQGQFSVNGQRPDANYFLVDGVSANLGTAGGGGPLGQSGAGQLPATSAFGGMSSLVSLDALEEFRIQTSTFAPEYGRTPGAQVSVVTKSGTNVLHGALFEYLRNDLLDANDWFANSNSLPKPALRQNDFGGVLGGPIVKEKLFFFSSYEGLRVRQPHTAETYVPSLTTRVTAPATVQPLLNAFPRPNGRDLGNGTSVFSASYSDPSALDSYSLRIDYLPTVGLTLFGRYNDALSEIDQRGAAQSNYSNVQNQRYRTQTLTLGTNQALSTRLTNEFRFNYSRSKGKSFLILDDFGGAVPPPNSILFPSSSPKDSQLQFLGDLTPNGLRLLTGKLGENWQHQLNVTNNFSYTMRTHQMKFGIDYRRLTPTAGPVPYTLGYVFGSVPSLLANAVAQAYVISRTADVQLIFSNWSLFAQDAWNVSRRLTLTYGLRWEYNTAPTGSKGRLPFTVAGLDNLETMKLAPAGTPLWDPQKNNFAPRLGIAFNPSPNLVLRSGAGIFYDLGYSSISNWASAFPYVQQKIFLNTSFPLSITAAAAPPFVVAPPVSAFVVVDPNHVLPRTYQWNATVERTLGPAAVGTLSYVGSAGRKLMRRVSILAPNSDFTGQFDILRNDASSSYHAFQAQFRQRLIDGLQTLFSYTWAHSIDNASGDSTPDNARSDKSPLFLERGPSDFDIRQTFSGAISYDVPGPRRTVWNAILGHWSLDSIIYVRSAVPVNVVTGKSFFAGPSGANSAARPDLVTGVPLYIRDSKIAGGRRINRAAFSVPEIQRQGTLGRNALRGFGAINVDLALRKRFAVTERSHLQVRADFFNIFNHPNFASPVNFLSSPLFGQSTQMLAGSLGSGGQNGGLNPLYQIGGPRSVQLSLKLQF